MSLIFAASHRPDLRVSDDDMLDFVLRKAAHLVVFGVLAVLVARLVQDLLHGGTGVLPVSWLATLAYAASDEWHQTFVDGRAGQPSDVAIDMAGATVALVAWHAWRRHGARAATSGATR